MPSDKPQHINTLGIIGGMSWQSTALYYQGLNAGVGKALGGLHSAPLVIDSLEFGLIAHLQHCSDWAGLEALLVASAKRLEAAGCDGILIATNTMHKLFDAVAASVDLPLLHIADGTGKALASAGKAKPLLLATGFTMEQDFYRGYLHDTYGIQALVPNQAERNLVHRIIYEELCKGHVLENSKQTYLDVIASVTGADALILGCTEICILLSQDDVSLPCFDTTALHIESAVEFILNS